MKPREEIIKPVLPKHLIKGAINFLVNPTGALVNGVTITANINNAAPMTVGPTGVNNTQTGSWHRRTNPN